ncbi:DUF2750 domain-containing protein [Oceanobacter mangrovi]|uniref:DUF2750 domain-containing protein n=1 Tax=Oceanobacter mangrovi TaxID=2862510 RepID=UPI001C8E0917|nr:DUF2750 domain-containing protein [Oceanobacter mangrovi]
MRFEPYDVEYAAIPTLSDTDRLDYFLMRAFETEDIWALRQGKAWFAREVDGVLLMPLWPYKRYASDAALDVWMDCRPDAMSLEFFMDSEIAELEARNILFDVMPREDQPGCVITPRQLAGILEGMQDAGEYRLEG